ncbi:MAG: hypothetical protein IKQ96_07750 [Lachnospiraceae bacterium]|nr:hypothetical protein [Lachnospiraceae bacterium]
MKHEAHKGNSFAPLCVGAITYVVEAIVFGFPMVSRSALGTASDLCDFGHIHQKHLCKGKMNERGILFTQWLILAQIRQNVNEEKPKNILKLLLLLLFTGQ